jgi:hypothetical protein
VNLSYIWGVPSPDGKHLALVLTPDDANVYSVENYFAGGLAAADDPFVGKWKFNNAQSKVTGGLQVIQDLCGNKYEFTFGVESWNVWVNGGDQPSGYGDTVSCKETGPNTWLVVHKNGQQGYAKCDFENIRRREDDDPDH